MRWTNVLLLTLMIVGTHCILAFIRGACQKLSWRWALYIAVLGSIGFAFIRSDFQIAGGEGFASWFLAALLAVPVNKLGEAVGRRVARRPREQVTER